MAKYELPIYGADDEILKTFKANICPWGVYVQAASLNDKIKDESASQQMKAIGDILKIVFVGMTDDDLMHADAMDVVNTFRQIVGGGQTIAVGDSKNAERAGE